MTPQTSRSPRLIDERLLAEMNRDTALIERIAQDYRVAVSDVNAGSHQDPLDAEWIIRGSNGHLYVDGGAIMVCFTDDLGLGKRRPKRSTFTSRFKTARLEQLKPFILRLKLEGEYEFIAQIGENAAAIRTAFRVLGIYPFRRDKGIHRPVSPASLQNLKGGGARPISSDTSG